MTTGSSQVQPWPPPPAVARLIWLGGEVVHTRVDRTGDELLAGRANMRAQLPPPGTTAELEWDDDHALHIRLVTVVTAHGGMLEVAPLGPSERIQRRQFFRAETSLGATVGHGDSWVRAVAVDLSEGGARLRLEGDPPVIPAAVTTHLVVDGQQIVVPGRVVRDATTAGDVGVAFDDISDGPKAAIRKQVFSAQLEARRKGTQQ